VLADDVALDLVGPTPDRQRRRGEEQGLPLAVGRARAGDSVGAEDGERGVREIAERGRGAELEARALRSRPAELRAGAGPTRGERGDAQLHDHTREALAHDGIGVQVRGARERDEAVFVEPRAAR